MRFAIVVALSALFSACAGDVEDLDRTQPGKIKKSALDGEWYFRQTVIDVPFATGVTFIGEQSVLERVRFEIAEDYLTAYRTYERVVGSEQPSNLPGTPYQGSPIAAFKILKHFDVVREYSPATGEQTNVIIENDFDRPWYERAYMRVDWSQNLLTNFDFIAGGDEGLYVTSQSASYVVTDPKSPDAPVFGVKKDGTWTDTRDPFEWGKLSRVDYFDVTLKLQVTPETFEIWYDDETTEMWPACWFYDEGPWDCASQTVKLRAAFMRVPSSDYEPLYYPDNYVARRPNGTPIRINPYEGVQCEEDEVNADCEQVRIPMFDWFGYFRTERETYDRDYGVTEEGRLYLINRFDIWEKSRDEEGNLIRPRNRTPKPIVYYTAENMPEALADATAEVALWWSDALRTTVDGVGATAPAQMFEIRKNTFRAEGGEIKDFGQRNGDLRYNHLYWVDDPQLESLLGYGPSGADPLTGEIIAADAYVYGAAIDRYAAQAADIIDLLRGDILETEFIEGENVGRAVARLGQAPAQNAEQMREQARDLMQRGVKDRLTQMRTRGKHAYRSTYDFTAARLRLADNDPRFDALWNNEIKQAIEPRLGRRLAPSQLHGGRLAKALRKHRQKLAARGVDLVSFSDQAVLGIFERMKTWPREQIIAEVQAALYKSTAAHEIGHTLGLRHNFAGSTDALNYHDEYWDVRSPTARTLDLPTDEEATAGLRERAYSSIMDYGAKWMSDIHGLGKYDVAAVKFGYGQLVETFVTPPWYEDHNVIYYNSLRDAVHKYTHYTDLPTLFATDGDREEGIVNMRERVDVPMNDIIDWMTYAPDAPETDYFAYDLMVPYKFCSDEYAGAVWDCDMWDEGADPYEIVSYAAQRWRDYYIFDAFKRHQRYVDPFGYYYDVYSRTMLPMSTQYHLWLYDQWEMYGEWAFLHSEFEGDTTTVENEDWNLDPHGGLARTAAAMASMNFLAEVLGTPEPGSYYQHPATPNVLTWWTDEEDVICENPADSWTENCSAAYVPLGNGRYAYSLFAADTGYYWFERVRVIGSFWDKLAAIETLVDPTTYFLGVDDVANYTSYILGFNVVFPRAVGALVGSIINDDYKYYAPTTDVVGNAQPAPLFSGVSGAYGDEIGGDLLSRPPPFVDPATNFTVSLYAMFYGMALLNANFDQTFNDFAKIWLEGSGEAFTPALGATIGEFTNPFNGRIYKAIKSDDPGMYSLGYEMVTRAQALADERAAATADCQVDPTSVACDVRDETTWQLQNLIDNMEVIRGYYDIFGYAWF